MLQNFSSLQPVLRIFRRSDFCRNFLIWEFSAFLHSKRFLRELTKPLYFLSSGFPDRNILEVFESTGDLEYYHVDFEENGSKVGVILENH